MHQIGSFLPISQENQDYYMPIFSKILTKFNSQEDNKKMEKSLFYSEMNQIMNIIESLCEDQSSNENKCLILIDNFAVNTSLINNHALH